VGSSKVLQGTAIPYNYMLCSWPTYSRANGRLRVGRRQGELDLLATKMNQKSWGAGRGLEILYIGGSMDPNPPANTPLFLVATCFANRNRHKVKTFWCTRDHGDMARGGHGLPKFHPGLPCPSMPCGRATPEMALQFFQGWPPTGWPVCSCLLPL
jgi:hypothetical protein